MSTFYDIWIGNTQPKGVRTGNIEWQQESEKTWLSLPEGANPFISRITDDSYEMILLGQLYEPITNNELLGRCVEYIEGNTKTYDDPAGHYIIFLLNNSDASIHVFTNRLGTYHAYWMSGNNKAISTRFINLVKQTKDRQLDKEGITGFMAMGYFPGDRTYLANTRMFAPASYYRFDATLTLQEQKRYWDWTFEPGTKTGEAYFDDIHDCLRLGLAYAVQDKRVAIPVSGGLDSRMLAGALTEKEMPYRALNAFSYGYTDNSIETRIAEQVANSRQIPFYGYTMPNYLFNKLDVITESVELFQYVDGTRQASATGWLAENADIVVGGHWGDVWLNNTGITSQEELLPVFQKKIVKRGSGWLLENVCSAFMPGADEYLQDYFNSFINKYQHIDDADTIMKIYKTDQWSHRWTTASLRMYQPGAFPVLPFYDKRLTDILMQVPASELSNRALQVEYIKHYYKDLAMITWQEYGADLYKYKYFNNRNIAYRATKKIQRTLSRQKPVLRNWEVFYLDDEGRRNLELHLLNNKELNEIVSKEKITSLLDSFYKDPIGDKGYTVSILLTFSIFLEKVLADQ